VRNGDADRWVVDVDEVETVLDTPQPAAECMEKARAFEAISAFIINRT